MSEIKTDKITAVLDTVYNVVEVDVNEVPEEWKETWEQYYDLKDEHCSLANIVRHLWQESLIDEESEFYSEFIADQYYNEHGTYIENASDFERNQWLSDWRRRSN